MSKMRYREHESLTVLKNPLYGLHVQAMTIESLRNKGEIAEELAWRDMQIADLKDQLAAAQAVNEKLREALVEIRNCNTFKWLCFEKGSPLDLMLIRADVALALHLD